MQEDKIKNWISKSNELLELEKREEEENLKEILSTTSIVEQEKMGLCFNHQRIQKAKYGIFNKIMLTLVHRKLINLKKDVIKKDIDKMKDFESIKFTQSHNKISTGDILGVYLLQGNGPKCFDDEPIFSAVVYQIQDFKLTVTVDMNDDDKFDLFGDGMKNCQLSVVQMVNNITYERYSQSLQRLDMCSDDSTTYQNHMIKVLFGLEDPDSIHPQDLKKNKEATDKKVNILDQTLNDQQQIAVKNCQNAENFSLVHGPPGTGKTKTVIEIIRQLANDGHKILVSAASNMAVDNQVERLIRYNDNYKLIRIGQPGRMLKIVETYCQDYFINLKVKKSPEVKEIKRDIKKLTLLKQKKTKENKTKKVASEMKDLWLQIKGKKKELKHAIDEISRDQLSEAQIVVSTSTSVYNKQVERYLLPKGGEKLDKKDKMSNRKMFDYAIIDEAAQALEVSTWMPILMSKKVVQAGDHKQLPPTIKCKEAESNGLGVTLFDKLMHICEKEKKEHLITLQQVQYRMNSKIMKISSEFMYGDKLLADKSVADGNLALLQNSEEKDVAGGDFIGDLTVPLLMIDTLGGRVGESQADNLTNTKKNLMGGMSKFNKGEALITRLIFEEQTKLHGIPSESIGVITPYSAQVELISNMLRSTINTEGDKEPIIEVSTVDGFQGREKEVIILSLVRSNPQGNIGFLKDRRRLNVAITRAKKQLVLVGDSKTISGDEFLNKIVEGVRTDGTIVNIFDFVNVLKGVKEYGEVFQEGEFNSGEWKDYAGDKIEKEKIDAVPNLNGKKEGDSKKDRKKKKRKNKGDGIVEIDTETKVEEVDAGKANNDRNDNKKRGGLYDKQKNYESNNIPKEKNDQDKFVSQKNYNVIEHFEKEKGKDKKKNDTNIINASENIFGIVADQNEASEEEPDKKKDAPADNTDLTKKKKRKGKYKFPEDYPPSPYDQLKNEAKGETGKDGPEELILEDKKGEDQKELTPFELAIEEELRQKKAEKRKKAKEAKKIRETEEKEAAEKKKEWDEGGFQDEISEANQAKENFCHWSFKPGAAICGLSLRWLSLRCKYCHQKFCTKHCIAEQHGCGDKACEDEQSIFKDRFYAKKPMKAEEEDALHKKLKDKISQNQNDRQPKSVQEQKEKDKKKKKKR